MNTINHLLGIREPRVAKFGRVPEVLIFTPVLPVLDNTIKRHFKLPVFFNNTDCFFLALVTFPALPISKYPSGKHRRLPGEPAITRNHVICTAATDEII